MFGHTQPLRTLNIHDKGSNYTVLDTDDATLLYTIHWTPNSAPHMTVSHGDDQSSVAGTATYHATKKHGLTTASDITLQFSSGTTTFNKEGGLFSSDKRILRSAELGEVHWQGGGSFSQSGFSKLVDANGKSLVDYKDMRVDSKMGTMDVHVELGKEALDEVVVSGIAMLSEERASMGASAVAMVV